jgi:hypothetical protein
MTPSSWDGPMREAVHCLGATGKKSGIVCRLVIGAM